MEDMNERITKSSTIDTFLITCSYVLIKNTYSCFSFLKFNLIKSFSICTYTVPLTLNILTYSQNIFFFMNECTDVTHSGKKIFRHTSMIKPKTENVTFDC